MRPSVEICSRDRDLDMLARPRWLRSPIPDANLPTMKYSRSQTPDFANSPRTKSKRAHCTKKKEEEEIM
ncbi:hypothetical protein TIFTF001_025108 [Ficus carica]|uniref:Uncharacterized protein n=1 Tax=Ficus carica TaxID=3494 RepID=A0AA88DGF6_FICCA|nr:hypothetical protein TIFTF001_025108 [Ficus carica]